MTTNRHIPALRRCANAHLVGVVDHQPGRAELVARRLGAPLFAHATQAVEVPWLDQIDAVTVGTPPQTHFAVAKSYLNAGKHVLLEKPMAMSISEAQDLEELAKKRNCVLGVVHNFQFTTSVQRACRLIENGQLGQIRSIWATQLSNPLRRLPSWYEQLPLGLFYDESPHFFYLLRKLAPAELQFRLVDVLGSQRGLATPSKITALLQAGQTPVQIDMNFEAPLSEWHIAILGAKYSAIIDLFRDILVLVPNDGLHLGRNILRTSAAATWSHLSGTARSGIRVVTGRMSYGNDDVVRRFCRACLGDSGSLQGIAPSDGVAVVRMQHSVLDHAK